MLISELIEFLNKYPQDAEVVVRTSINTYVRPSSYGLIRLVPIEPGSKYDKRSPIRQLLPGNEWRKPMNSKDESEVKRIYGFTL